MTHAQDARKVYGVRRDLVRKRREAGTLPADFVDDLAADDEVTTS